MHTFKYSVVIPHFNSSSLLKEMVKSIPERNDIEIIVVDDNSSAQHKDELKNLKHDNLHVLYNESNMGAGYSRNVGLSHIRGEWVSVVDADDFFNQAAFDTFDKAIDNNIDYINYTISYFNQDTEMHNTNPNSFSNHSVLEFIKNPTKKTVRYFKLRNTVCYNKLVRADFIKENNIKFEEVPVNNDVFYAYQVSLKAKYFKVISDCLYHKKIVSSSITKRKRNIEREFLFFLQAKKRSGLAAAIGLKRYPFYRSELLYIPYLIKKRGLLDMIKFFKYRLEHKAEVKDAFNAYTEFFRDLSLNDIDDSINFLIR